MLSLAEKILIFKFGLTQLPEYQQLLFGIITLQTETDLPVSDLALPFRSQNLQPLTLLLPIQKIPHLLQSLHYVGVLLSLQVHLKGVLPPRLVPGPLPVMTP